MSSPAHVRTGVRRFTWFVAIALFATFCFAGARVLRDHHQRQAGDDARLTSQADVAAAMVTTLHDSTIASQRMRLVAERAGERTDRPALRRLAMAHGAYFAELLDRDGVVLGASSRAPHRVGAVVVDPDFRRYDVVGKSATTLAIPVGSRTVVLGFPSEALNLILTSGLARLPSPWSANLFVLDGTGRVAGSWDVGGARADRLRVPAATIRAAGARVERFGALSVRASPVRGTSWTFVVQASRMDLDEDAGNGALILALTLFAAAGLTLVLVLLLHQRSRRHAREHLAAHERASAVLSLVDDGYLFLRDGRVVDVNDRFGEIAGVDAGELRDRGAGHEAIVPFAALASEVDVPRQVQVDRPDGSRTDVVVIVRDAPDGLDGAILLVRDVTSHKREERRLSRLASTDGLTGLLNRGAFDAGLDRLVREARESDLPLSLVILDVDHFKAINDRYGHPVGDRVLVEVARRLRTAARDGDVVGRVGGEEFAWVLPGVDGPTAHRLAERARRAVVAAPFPEVGVLGLSAGVCCCAEHDATELYRCADDALLTAKRTGRDRAVTGDRCGETFVGVR